MRRFAFHMLLASVSTLTAGAALAQDATTPPAGDNAPVAASDTGGASTAPSDTIAAAQGTAPSPGGSSYDPPLFHTGHAPKACCNIATVIRRICAVTVETT